ncbi:MAG TPA: class I SAM-dependent methyltransferase [Polyangiaceae bacterium]|nr:class I SAM-dependent methyltransferase [Polyangiaceae bacterium]
MRPGQESKTAVMVCMGRALADSDPTLPGFSDPTAFELLPEEARRRVERVRAEGIPKRGLKKAIEHGFLLRQSKVMAARTLEIDAAVREAASPQVVILGAGLDGRAWRMPELCDVSVFEVDHPDSQREKRKRVASLAPVAKDVRFVPVDFAHDDLEQALASAGHDASRPTTWVWEGVVMYLTQRAIDATLAVIARRSAQGSRLIVVYHCPRLILRLLGPGLRWWGEPLRSAFRPEKMRDLLSGYGFHVERDRSAAEVGRAISAELGASTRVAEHLRIAVADLR